MAPYRGATNLLLLSNPDGTYSDRSATLPQTPDFSHAASVADINGDGYLDIYVGNTGGAAPIGPYFLVGRGDGTFTQQTTGLPSQMTSFQQRFLCALLVDVDGDGHPDLVLGSQPTPGFIDNVVLFNNGTGADFTSRPQYVLPPGPLPRDNTTTEDIVSLDVNQDGQSDLILLSSATLSDNGVGLQVLINHGNGTLVDETATHVSPATDRLTGPWYPFIHFADFNGDGWNEFYLDTLLHEDRSIHPRVWRNNGNNTWTPVAPSALPPEFSFGDIHAVDFEGDGRPDILRLGGVFGGSPPDIGYSSFMNRTGLPPLAPGTLTTTPPGPAVTLSWQAADLATSYQLEAGSAPGLRNLFTGNVGLVTSLSAAPPAGLYYARVRAVNGFGAGSPSNEVALLVGSCPQPFAPTGFASSVTGSLMALSWSGAPGATSYVLEAGSSPGLSNLFNGNVGSSTSLSGAVPSALYFLRVRGANACGAGPASSELDMTVACPSLSAPSGFAAAVTGAAVTLQWSAVPSATSYLLEVGVAPNVWNLFVGSIGPGTSLVAPNVPAGSYAMRVRAQGACGVSAPSTTVTAVVP